MRRLPFLLFLPISEHFVYLVGDNDDELYPLLDSEAEHLLPLIKEGKCASLSQVWKGTEGLPLSLSHTSYF